MKTSEAWKSEFKNMTTNEIIEAVGGLFESGRVREATVSLKDKIELKRVPSREAA